MRECVCSSDTMECFPPQYFLFLASVVPYVATGSTLGRDRLVFESTTQLGGLGSVDRKGSTGV